MSDIIDQNNEPLRPDTAVPHAGKTDWERPVHEFDNTPLAEAVNQGLVGEAPHDVSGLVDAPAADTIAPESPVPESEEHKKRLWPKKVLVGLGLITAGGAGVLGTLIVKSKGNDKVAANGPVAMAPSASSGPEVTTTTASPEKFKDLNQVVLPTSDDPQTLLDALMHNQDCYLNFGNVDCKKNYIKTGARIGYISREDDLSQILDEERQVNASYLKDNPDDLVSHKAIVTNYDFNPSSPGANDQRRIEYAMTHRYQGRTEQLCGYVALKPSDVLTKDGRHVIAWKTMFTYNYTPEPGQPC